MFGRTLGSCVLVVCVWLSNAFAEIPTTENLRGISVVSSTVAWASGTHGTYLRTEDGGRSWEAAQVPGAESLDFRDVEAFDANLAYLLAAGPGDQSRIYKTVDAGKHWSLQFTNHDPKGFFDCMAFWDRDNGVVVGDPVPVTHASSFELITTHDGGAHWIPLAPDAMPPAIEGEGAFAASGTCIAVQGENNAWFATGGKAARVFRSTNGGKSWTAHEAPIVHGEDSTGIFTIAFRDAKHGVIAGGDYKHPEKSGANLAYSADGGNTWKLSDASPQAYFSALAYDKRHRRLLVTGPVLTLEFYGKIGRKISDQDLNALSISPEGHGIAVGPKGLIVDFDVVNKH